MTIRRTGRRMAAVGTAIALPLTMVACSSGGSESGESGEPPASAEGTVNYMTWESIETNNLFDKIVAEKWDNPDITINRVDAPSGDYSQKLGSLAQAQKLPDIFWCGNDTEQQYTQMGILTDWTDKIASDFKEGELGFLDTWKTPENGIGGLPSLINVTGIWYNQTLFEENNVPLPTQDWTWDGLYSAAAALKGAGGSTYPLLLDGLTSTSGPVAMGQYAMSAGGQPFVDDVNNPTKAVADDKFMEGLDKLVKAIGDGLVNPPDFNLDNSTSLFAAGSQPMMSSGQWLAQSFGNDAKGFEWGWAPLPSQSTPATFYDAIGMCTPQSTANADDTWEVAKFLETEVIPEVMAQTPVAPPAYEPGRQGYLDSIKDLAGSTISDTLEYSLGIENTTGVRLTTTWASQAGDLAVQIWTPILKGEKPIEEVSEYVDGVNQFIETGGQ